MPTIVCERCDECQTASVFNSEPACRECGATSFRPEDGA